MPVTDARVAVVGGSLAGLTAALLLRDQGLDVTLYERSKHQLERRGAGLAFLPDASRYLVERLGIDIDTISTSVQGIRYLARDGSVRHQRRHTYHYTSWFTTYGLLHQAFGDDRYLIGHEAVGAVLGDDTATVQFESGEEVEADLLVCADGVGSAFRRQFIPGSHIKYSGYVAWRGMVPESELDPALVAKLDDAVTFYFSANSQLLVYPIPGPDGEVAPGTRLLNFVWYRNYRAGDDFRDLMTDVDGTVHEASMPPGAVRPEHVAELHAHARARVPSILAEIVVSAREPFLQEIADLSIDQMAFGRACLIGDAGFVMRPHAGAGTAKAAANAWGLSESLLAHDTIPEALADWEPEQLRIGHALNVRTQRLGARSQITSTWDWPEDDTLFRLRDEGP